MNATPVHGDSRAGRGGTAGRCPCPGPRPAPALREPHCWNRHRENTQASGATPRLGSAPDPAGFPPREWRGSPVPPRSTPALTVPGRPSPPVLQRGSARSLQGPGTSMLALKEAASLSPSFSPLLEGLLLLTEGQQRALCTRHWGRGALREAEPFFLLCSGAT